MAEETPEEFVTVSAAAAMLGVSDRTARRMAGQLADDDRTPDSGQGRRVRLSAMRSLREKGGQPADSVAGQNPAMTDRTKSAGRGRPVNVSDPVTGEKLAEALQRAAVAEAVNERLSGEVAFLRESLQREQAIAMTATSDAAELRRKLEALTDGLIEAKASVPDVGNETVQKSPETATESRKTTETAGFWGRVRAFFSEGER